MLVLESLLTCPECGHKSLETMPTDACQWFSKETSQIETAKSCFMNANIVMKF